MIKGLTHDKTGAPVQRLAVSTKIAIGLPPDVKAGRKAPTKLDHFIFLKKSTVEQNKWEIDGELTHVYGKNCREIEIVLLDDSDDNVFPTKLAWFNATQCLCFGDGDTATRRTTEHPDGQPWLPCGSECPQNQSGECKPSGDLFFMLAAFPKLGSVARLHTTGKRSILQVTSSIRQIQTITGGRLAGIRCMLVLRPEKTAYKGKDGVPHTTTIYAFNLEIKADGIKELISKMTDHARLFEQTRKLLGTGRIEVMEDDNARAGEIAAEFYHTDIAPPAKFPDAEEAEIVEPIKQPNMDVICSECRKVNGHADDCFQVSSALPASGKCPECRQDAGHHRLCKHYKAPVIDAQPAQDGEPKKKATEPPSEKKESATKPENEKMALFVKTIEERHKTLNGKKSSYLVLSVIDKEKLEWDLYVWSKSLQERAAGLGGKTFLGEISQKKQANRTFCQLEAILEVAGEAPILDGDPDPPEE